MSCRRKLKVQGGAEKRRQDLSFVLLTNTKVVIYPSVDFITPVQSTSVPYLLNTLVYLQFSSLLLSTKYIILEGDMAS